MQKQNAELLEFLDLKANGLDKKVGDNIRKNRMGNFRLQFQPTDQEERPLIHAKLIRHDFFFGCNAFLLDLLENEEKNQQYREAFTNLFNMAILPFYWYDDEPSRGVTRYSRDSKPRHRRPVGHHILDFCSQNGLTPKAHNFFYHQKKLGIPDWLSEAREEIPQLFHKRVEAIAKEYGSSIPYWDVVNEALTRFYDDILPEDYVFQCFQKADQYFPNNNLLANEDTRASWLDFAWENSPYYLYLNNLVLRGARLDAIGMQYHLFYSREQLKAHREKLFHAQYLLDVLDQYGKLNRDIHISEITLSAYSTAADDEEMQAQILKNLYSIWFSSPNVKAMIYWNLVDGYAHSRPGWNENDYHGGLIDHDFRRKPAYQMLEQLIKREWHTEIRQTADLNCAEFQGYYGTYRVEIEWPNGIKEVRNLHLNASGDYTFS